MVTAIDTNIAIEFFRNNKNVIEKISSYETIYLPITVIGELLFGASNSVKSKKKLNETLNFIKDCKVLNINYIVAERYAEIRKYLKRKGKPIPENDIWIAAHSIETGSVLITYDKHFNHISGLRKW